MTQPPIEVDVGKGRMVKDELYRAHEEYVKGVVPLMVWHIWDLAQQGVMPITKGLDEVCWLYRLTTLTAFGNGKWPNREGFENPAWEEMKAKLVSIMEDCHHQIGTEEMESKCLELLMPVLEPRFFGDSRVAKRPFQCWGYTTLSNGTIISVHLANAEKPRSPFDDMKRFGKGLLAAILDGKRKHPQSHTVMCNSWLNNVPKFLQLWPKSFADNRTHWQDTGGFGPGRWGQYMTRTGGFNWKAAEHLRKTGRHRNRKSSGTCRIEEAIGRLNAFIS